MKNLLLKISVVTLGTLIVASCSLESYEESDLENYTKEYISEFGLVDDEQTWNMATQVTANIELDDDLEADSVYVYTSIPGGSDCEMVAAYPATTKTFTFDYLLGAEDAYVVVTNSSNNIVLGDYFDIVDGVTTVTNKTSRATTTECPTTTNGAISDLGSFQDYNENFVSGSTWQERMVRFTDIFSMYNLANVSTEPAASWKLSDMDDIVGTGGVFAENGLDDNNVCNIIKWEDELKASEGVTYTMTSKGTVELSYIRFY